MGGPLKPEAARVLLVRHCQSSGREPEAPLTPEGEVQARALADALAAHSVDRIVSSPFRRARTTIEPLASRLDIPVELDDRLAEWQLPWVPRAHWPAALEGIYAGTTPLPPGYEPLVDARTRALAVLENALALRKKCPVLVTHGKLLALLLAAIQGRAAFPIFVDLENPHVFDVKASPAGLTVQSLWRPTG